MNMLSLTLMAARQLAEEKSPVQGIYYSVCLPTGWKLIAGFFEGEFSQPPMTNIQLWQTQILPLLAYQWSEVLVQEPELRKNHEDFLKLRMHRLCYAFPQGRVFKESIGKYRIEYGNQPPMWLPSKDQIAETFGVFGLCDWKHDRYLRCKEKHAQAVRELLGVEKRWAI